MDFWIEDFEATVAARSFELAYQQLVQILEELDRANGSLDHMRMKYIPARLTLDERESLLATRVAQAVGQIFTDPNFQLSDEGFLRLMQLHRWLSSIFAATPMLNADHLIRQLGGVGKHDPLALDVHHPDLLKLCVLYTTESDLSLNGGALWQRSPVACANLMLALLSPRHMVSVNAHRKRESISSWLPAQLSTLADLSQLPWAIMHDTWMHSSYLDQPDKHEIKRALNLRVQELMHKAGCPQWEPGDSMGAADQPTLVVMLEWFHVNHSVFRTHSESLRSLRQHYRLVGVGIPDRFDQAATELFDEFHVYTGHQLAAESLVELAQWIRSKQPALIYYLGVGMFPYTIMLSNVRLAPIQLVALGHGASTFSTCMDYFLIDEDFVGDPKCYSERVLSLPKGTMPFVRPAFFDGMSTEVVQSKGVMKVAVPASTMKLNPAFIDCIRRIGQACGDAAEFHFFAGFSMGLVYQEIRREILRDLPHARVYRHMDQATYMKALSECDMFLNPFPYGNMNSIVDTAIYGMPGICLTGDQPHSAIDQGIFERLNRPDHWVVTHSVQAYEKAAKNMIEREKDKLRERQFSPLRVDVLYCRGAVSLADCFLELQDRHPDIQSGDERLIRLGFSASSL